jgi:plasmid stabilization system protein ParE
MRVVWAPLALERAAEIARYIAAGRPAAAARWIDRLVQVVAPLAAQLRCGRRVPELDRDDLREVLHGAYRVIYRVDARPVVIPLTVRHGRRQIDPGELTSGNA